LKEVEIKTLKRPSEEKNGGSKTPRYKVERGPSKEGSRGGGRKKKNVERENIEPRAWVLNTVGGAIFGRGTTDVRRGLLRGGNFAKEILPLGGGMI